MHKARVHKSLCVTGKKMGKCFVKNGKENRRQQSQKQTSCGLVLQMDLMVLLFY